MDSGESYEEEIDQKRLELETNQEHNIKRLVLMARYLIRAVGDHVKILVLGCCPGLTNGLVGFFELSFVTFTIVLYCYYSHYLRFWIHDKLF